MTAALLRASDAPIRSHGPTLRLVLASALAAAIAASLPLAYEKDLAGASLSEAFALLSDVRVLDVSVAGPPPARVHPGADIQEDDLYVHVPAGAPEPLTVLVLLHGMGDRGEEFSRSFLPRSDAAAWVVVAPTFRYGDWRDPAQLTREAGTHLPRMVAMLDRLREVTGFEVEPRALLYGFSRGGQSASRFALVYPERVAGVAVASSGTYTIPLESFNSADGPAPLRFPFGVSDLRELFGHSLDGAELARVPFWLGVGGRDTNPADVPQQWAPYVGANRVERAERYTAWLRRAGVTAQLNVFADVGHGETDEMRASAMSFLAQAAGPH